MIKGNKKRGKVIIINDEKEEIKKLNVLDLFCGCGGMSKGLRDAGLNIIAGIDIWDRAIESYKENNNHKSICGDLTKLSPELLKEKYEINESIDIIVGGPPCFTKGTMVLTNVGYKKIEDVCIEDKIMTHLGRYRGIKNIQIKEYRGNLYKIKTEFNSKIIQCTEEHPFYVRRKTDIGYKKAEWKKINEMDKMDFIGMIYNCEEEDIEIDNINLDNKIMNYNEACYYQRRYAKKNRIIKIIFVGENKYKLEEVNDKNIFIEDGYIWYKIDNIEIVDKSNKSEIVYNFEIEEDNSYIVENIIVHNCQGFSIAGKRDTKDPRNSLFMEYCKYLDYFKPKAFVMENVIGILSMKTESGEKVIDIIRSNLEKNYECCINKLYASDFEVPQNRRRTIIIGLRKDLKKIPKEITPFLKKDKRIAVKTVLEDNVDRKYYLSERAIDGINRKREKSKKEGKGFGAQFLDPDKPSYTIPARYWKDGYDALVKYDESNIRRLTITELKRIQTFPDNYIILGNNKEIIMQIGNAVPCKFAYHIGKYLINILQ